MKKLAILIDLDDTLLTNSMGSFQPAYLKALSTHLAPLINPEKMVSQLLFGTQMMMKNDLPERTLESVFDQYFYAPLGLSKDHVIGEINKFYANKFPDLRSLTEARPEASSLVVSALKEGNDVIVATNPLFPLTAIEQRLAWAGLSPDEFPFTLIPSFERFHFSKPHISYYAELMAQAGWPEKPAVMIGNSLEDDIRPASQLGLPVFWLSDGTVPIPFETHPLSASGKIADIQPWLNRVGSFLSTMVFSTPGSLKAVLISTPAALARWIEGITQLGLKTRPAPHDWSLTEILCHLRDVDQEVNIPRIKQISKDNNPFLPGIETDHWAEERHYLSQDGFQAYQDFMASRVELVNLLTKISPEIWEKPVRHAIFGPTRLTELMDILASHDITHIRQIRNVVKSQSRDVVNTE